MTFSWSISPPRLNPMHYLHASFTFLAGILFNFYPLENICILNARLGGEIDQHKAYSPRKSRENQNQTSALRSYVCQLQPQHRRTVQTFLKKSMKSPAKSKKSLFSTSWNFKSVEAELNRNWTKRRNYRQNWLRMRAVNRLLRFSPPLIWMVLLHLIWMPWDE